jgi:hypothetical protein
MYYYGARYYDPRISIFISVDPLAEKYPGWTPYHYVHNNPINMVDPTGMEADGWRKNLANGEMSYDDSYTFENTPEGFEYGDAFITPDRLYNSDGSTSAPLSLDDSVSCVECHHTTGQDMQTSPVRNPRNILDVKEGVTMWGEGSLSANNLMAENKRGSVLFSLDLGEVSARSSTNLKEGTKGFYELLSGYSSRENDYKKGGDLFKFDKVAKYNYQNYSVGRPAYTGLPYSATPTWNGKDTFLLESKIRSTDWNKVSRLDSLKKAGAANKLNKQHNLR